MKVFPHSYNGPSQFYKNELNILDIKDPNIIEIVQHKEIGNSSLRKEMEIDYSYILMDQCLGSFLDFVAEKWNRNEDLVRTYFR